MNVDIYESNDVFVTYSSKTKDLDAIRCQQ